MKTINLESHMKPIKALSESGEFVLIPMYRSKLDGKIVTNKDPARYDELEFLGYLLKPIEKARQSHE